LIWHGYGAADFAPYGLWTCTIWRKIRITGDTYKHAVEPVNVDEFTPYLKDVQEGNNKDNNSGVAKTVSPAPSGMLSSVELARQLPGRNTSLSGASSKNWLSKAGVPSRGKIEDATTVKAEDKKRKEMSALLTNIFSGRREGARREDCEWT
jgi:hypothetical protein